jgi:hypothetical protein
MLLILLGSGLLVFATSAAVMFGRGNQGAVV